jgi:peptide/nickel transport system substrate-binding protein
MYNNGPQQPDPAVFLKQFLSSEVATKANKWQGRNITRWVNKEYDDTHSRPGRGRIRSARRP